MTPFPSDPRPVGDMLSDVTGAGLTITFSQELYHSKIGDGWELWSHGYTGDVYDTAASLTDPTSLTLTFSSSVHAFYLFVEPTQWDNFNITALTDAGAILSQTVDGEGGAAGFGFYTDGTESISSITIRTTDTDGFAIGEFAFNQATGVPDGGCTLFTVAFALLSLGYFRSKVGALGKQ